MMPAARAPPKPVPEEGAGAALLEEPALDAVGRAVAGPDLMADEGVVADEGVALASVGLTLEPLAVAEPGLLAALGDAAAAEPLPTTGAVPIGVAGTDPGAPLAVVGFAVDDADAPPVAAAAAGAWASSFAGGVGTVTPGADDAAPVGADEAGFVVSGEALDTSFALALDTVVAPAPAVTAGVGVACGAATSLGAPAPPSGFAAACAPVSVVLSPSVTVFFSALRSIVCPRVCFGFDRRGRLVIAFAPFLLALARGFARFAHRTQSRRIGPSFVRAAQASSRPNDQSRLVDAFEKRSKPGI
ncbi:hypothetical protein [Aurantimonas marina]|uniref:hypothetical protein n=1 Tax=Aurantimonas marina TaxID=2780508 RepID=UPI0019CF6044|nr:hypothetical protein [Aurantimonas marina]